MTLLAPRPTARLPLTDQQQCVVNSDSPAIVAMASAGTGKTEVLAQRVERFVTDPDTGHSRVLVVTYTTRAAHEFQERLQDRVPDSMARIHADTIHGFANWILNAYGTHVGLSPNFHIVTSYEDRAELKAEFSNGTPPSDYRDHFQQLDLARARCQEHPELAEWRDTLNRWGAVDFGEMISKATEVLNIPAISSMMRVVFGLVIVDEAQNLTEQQYRFLIALIGRDASNSTALVPTALLGDPKQCVTDFAGGDNQLMQRFKSDYGATEFRLTQNFRSSRRLASLEQVLSHQLHQVGTRLRSLAEDSARGQITCHDFADVESEGTFVAKWAIGLVNEGLPAESVGPAEHPRVLAEDIAVLARHSSTLQASEDALDELGFETARAHSESDLVTTRVGATAILLMQLHSDRHRMAAWAAIRRELALESADLSLGDFAAGRKAISKAISTPSHDHLDVLGPLLEVERPGEFVTVLGDCQLSSAAPNEMLAGWHADRELIENAWSEFAAQTPQREQDWGSFMLHFDRAQHKRDLGPGIRLLTVHKAQGREFKAVAVIGMNDGQFPDFRAKTKEARQAELQAFYVAATRASRVLLLTRAKERPTRYGSYPTEPSPYLEFAKKALTADGSPLEGAG